MRILIIAYAAILAYIVWSISRPMVRTAYGEEACIRATTNYQRIYPPEGTILNRRPASWQVCTPWGP